jgi:hypothetical protein
LYLSREPNDPVTTAVSAYWIIRRSLSSGAHSRDPAADDDGLFCRPELTASG